MGIDRRTAVVLGGSRRAVGSFVASGGQDVGPRPAPGMTLGSGQMTLGSGQMTRGPGPGMTRGLGPGMTLGLGPGVRRGLAVRQRAMAAHASPRVMAGAGRPPTTFVASGGQDVGPRPAPGMTRGLGPGMTLGSVQQMARGPAPGMTRGLGPGMTLGSGVRSAVERRS